MEQNLELCNLLKNYNNNDDAMYNRCLYLIQTTNIWTTHFNSACLMANKKIFEQLVISAIIQNKFNDEAKSMSIIGALATNDLTFIKYIKDICCIKKFNQYHFEVINHFNIAKYFLEHTKVLNKNILNSAINKFRNRGDIEIVNLLNRYINQHIDEINEHMGEVNEYITKILNSRICDLKKIIRPY